MTYDTMPNGELSRDELLRRLQELRAGSHRFRGIVEHARDAIYIVHPRHGFRYVNHAFEELTGYTTEDVRADDFSFWDIVHPGDVDMIWQRDRSRERGEEVPSRYEFRILARDGDVRMVEAATMPIDDGEGLIAGILRDITDRVEMERAMQESKDMFRGLAERSFDGIFSFDGRGRFTYASPAVRNIAGYAPEEVEGTFFGRYILKRDIPKMLMVFARLRRGASVEGVTFRIQRKDGGIRTVEVNAVPVVQDGKAVGAQGNIRDVTEREMTEKRLRESEERYATLYEQSNDAIMLFDLTGRVVDVNERYEETFGRTEEEVVGKRFTELDIDYNLHTKDIFRKMERLARRRDVEDFDITVHDRTIDETYVVHVKANLIKLPEGRFIQVVIRDVTERRQAEQALHHQRKYFEALFNGSPEAIASLDACHHVITVNPAFEALFGYTSGELRGKNLDDVIVPERLQDEGRSISRQVEQGDVVKKESVRCHRDGGEVPVSILGAPVVIDGEQQGIFGIYRDISARVTAQQALRESEEKYRDMVENINDVLYTTDMEGTITYISPVIAQMSGYTPGEVVGKPFTDFVHEDDVPRIRERFKQIISGDRDGRPSPDEYRITVASGDVRWVRTSSRPIFEDGDVVGLRGVMTDVTGRKHAEQKIAELNDTLRLINKIMCHDILNDLQIAQSSLELYGEEAEPALYDKARQRMHQAVELINRMRGLESLVASAKELRPVNLREVADDVAAGCGVDCRVEGSAVVMADEALHSVVQNLVHNAVVHGNADEIVVSMHCADDICMLRVADNGVGIPDEIKQQVFEEGFSHGGTGSTGLGLYIVKQTVERYGGSVAVEDNTPRGARFVLRFPRGNNV
ncbi:MAG: PAS domain S-box protein [Thermoplasmatota archaeon]